MKQTQDSLPNQNMQKLLDEMRVKLEAQFIQKSELETLKRTISLMSNKLLTDSAAFMTGHLKQFQQTQSQAQFDIDGLTKKLKTFDAFREKCLETFETH